MSGAVSASTVAMVTMGAGAGFSAVSAYNNSKASKTALDAQAQVQRNNAIIAGWQADDALARGNRSAMKVQSQGRTLQGQQRAGFGASGVDVNAGSALEILKDTQYFTDVDVATTKDNAAREAWAIRSHAAGYAADASLLQSRSDAESPTFAAATSMFGSAGKVASSWYTPGSSASGGSDPLGTFMRGTRGSGD